MRPRPKYSSLNGETETKTEKLWVSMMRPRLQMYESQWRDQDRDWKNLSLRNETEQKMLIPRLNRDSCWLVGRGMIFAPLNEFDMMNLSSLVRFLLFGFSLPNKSTRLWYFVDVETKPYRDWQIYWVSRPRLIETEKFLWCQDLDSSRLRNFLDVETEAHRDWTIPWMSRLRLIETKKLLGCWDWEI